MAMCHCHILVHSADVFGPLSHHSRSRSCCHINEELRSGKGQKSKLGRKKPRNSWEVNTDMEPDFTERFTGRKGKGESL